MSLRIGHDEFLFPQKSPLHHMHQLVEMQRFVGQLIVAEKVDITISDAVRVHAFEISEPGQAHL
jgi:hypothetical protein